MALIALVGSKILVKVSDGATPPNFVHSCMINLTRSISFEAQMQDDPLQDCDNPEKPASVQRFKVSNSFSIEGAGKMDVASLDFWLDFQESPDPKDAEVVINALGSLGGQVITCQLHCSKVALTGEPHKNAEATVSLMSHGTWSREANAG